jgi:hypothetical protein
VQTFQSRADASAFAQESSKQGMDAMVVPGRPVTPENAKQALHGEWPWAVTLSQSCCTSSQQIA